MHSAGSIPMMSLSCCLQLTSGTRRHTVDWQRGNGRWRRKPLRRSRLCRRSTRLKRRRWTLRGLLTVRIRRQRGSRLRPEQLDSWNPDYTAVLFESKIDKPACSRLTEYLHEAQSAGILNPYFLSTSSITSPVHRKISHTFLRIMHCHQTVRQTYPWWNIVTTPRTWVLPILHWKAKILKINKVL